MKARHPSSTGHFESPFTCRRRPGDKMFCFFRNMEGILLEEISIEKLLKVEIT